MADWDCPRCGNDPEDCYCTDSSDCTTPGCCGDGACEICTCCDRGHCSNEHVVVGGSVHAPGNEAAWQQIGHVGVDYLADDAVPRGEVWVAPKGTRALADYAAQLHLYQQEPRRDWWNDKRDGGTIIVHEPTTPGGPPHVEHLPPTYQQQPHSYVDGIAAAALQHAGVRLEPWQADVLDRALYADVQGAVDWPGVYRAARSNLTVEVAHDPAAFDLLMFGRSRAAHELLQRLNMRWKYRVSPGVPEKVRRELGGDPELHATPVIVEVDGRRIEALAERGFNTVKLYPAHPKGTRTK